MFKIGYKEHTAYGFIYLTTNLINDKKYVGQRSYSRKHEIYLGSGALLLKAIKKHGKENFKREILEEAQTKEELDKLEIKWIRLFNAVEDDNFYNISYGGKGGSLGTKRTEEQKKKMSEQRTGRKLTDEWRNNIAKANKLKKHKQETKDTMRKQHSIPVICTTTGDIFESAKEAGRKLGINKANIAGCCKNRPKYNSAGKHPETGEKLKWMYYEEWLESMKI